MDWSNEPYVRLYIRDTTNWKRIGWDGQCVLMALLRKVDRSGAIDLDELEPWEAAMLHTGAPEEVARRGVEALLRVGSLEVRGKVLVFPNHIAAQEASKSDKLRAKESRERRSLGLTVQPSQNVTAPSRVVTQESRPVTTSHDESQPVTPRHSLLCSADPLQSSAVLGSAAPGDAPAQSAPSALDRFEAVRPMVRAEFAMRFATAEGSFWTQSTAPAVDTLTHWLLSLKEPPEAALKRLLDVFFADDWARSQHFPIAHLSRYPQKYFEKREAPAKGGPAPVDVGGRIAELNADLDKLAAKLNDARLSGNAEREKKIVAKMDEHRTEIRKLKGKPS